MVFNHTAELDADGPTPVLRGLANARATTWAPRLPRLERLRQRLNLGEPRLVELVMGACATGPRATAWTASARPRGDHRARPPRPLRCRRAVRRDRRPAARPPQVDRLRALGPGPDGYRLAGSAPGWMEWNDQLPRHDARLVAAQPATAARSPTVSPARRRSSTTTAAPHRQHQLPVRARRLRVARPGEPRPPPQPRPTASTTATAIRTTTRGTAAWKARATTRRARPARPPAARPLLASLLLAQGTPMLLAGDEIGHSQGGNNNAYCQDNATTRPRLGRRRAPRLRAEAARPAPPTPRYARPPGCAAPSTARACAGWNPMAAELQAADLNEADRGPAIWLHAAPTRRARPHTVLRRQTVAGCRPRPAAPRRTAHQPQPAEACRLRLHRGRVVALRTARRRRPPRAAEPRPRNESVEQVLPRARARPA